MKRQTFPLLGLVVLVLAVPVFSTEAIYPNISNRDDTAIFLNEVRAEIIQVRETDDPESPLLFEIQAVYIPQLVGEQNSDTFREGPVMFVTVWSPEIGEDFGFYAVTYNTVTVGSATGFAPSFATANAVGNFNTSGSNGSNTNVGTDDSGNVGWFMPWQITQSAVGQFNYARSNNQSTSYNDGDIVGEFDPLVNIIQWGNYNTARSNNTSTTYNVVDDGIGDEGEFGDALPYLLSQLDLNALFEAVSPWWLNMYCRASGSKGGFAVGGFCPA